MQSLKGLLPTDYPSLLAPWLVGGAAKMALNAYGKSGMAARLPMLANLVISNVPGAQVPLYLAGAEFLSFHPLSIITHGLGLNITIQTYAGRVDFGIVADKKALPHAADLAKAVEAAFVEAQTLLATTQVTGAPIKRPLTKKPVAKATQAATLGKSPSLKTHAHRDTVLKSKPSQKSNAPSHGKTAVKKISRGKTARRPTIQP